MSEQGPADLGVLLRSHLDATFDRLIEKHTPLIEDVDVPSSDRCYSCGGAFEKPRQTITGLACADPYHGIYRGGGR